MDIPTPDHIAGARAQLAKALPQIDLQQAPLSQICGLLLEGLGGSFDPQRQDHQVAALALGAVVAERLCPEYKGFWFLSREAPGGAALGFPQAFLVVSPIELAVRSLSENNGELLDRLGGEVREGLRQAVDRGQVQSLGRADYERVLDPAYVQLIRLDREAVQRAWARLPADLAQELGQAMASLQGKVPDQERAQIEGQIRGVLQQIDQSVSVADQVQRQPRVAELLAMLWGATHGTGVGPDGFWQEIAFPLAFIGEPSSFPALDEDEVENVRKGMDPISAFLDIVPYRWSAPEDEGLLGAFPFSSLRAIDERFHGVSSVRLIEVDFSAIASALEAFDPAVTRSSLEKFCAHVRTFVPEAPAGPEGDLVQQLDAALRLMTDVKRLAALGGTLCLRRLTEGEAAAERILWPLRAALQGRSAS